MVPVLFPYYFHFWFLHICYWNGVKKSEMVWFFCFVFRMVEMVEWEREREKERHHFLLFSICPFPNEHLRNSRIHFSSQNAEWTNRFLFCFCFFLISSERSSSVIICQCSWSLWSQNDGQFHFSLIALDSDISCIIFFHNSQLRFYISL